ncbi:putative xanthine dehydrogenase subunit A [Lacunisphaera limnophila]|uniref:Putative xanthine dehydrogenase subunit A n=1 Tax=Lacunisphaera limnophila TaxID=1838286 RepID=A0A1D8AV83_9BACT|nr:XdhC family protein [Lacunisphaera limnophila]AOS44756.1 putative xanthine dehydrogenase subunit A [Lacunisphaera limnophila]
MPEISRILTALDSAAGQPAALATLVKVEGSSYRRPGARLLLLPDGTRLGSISGGCLEEDVIERARRVLATGQPDTAVYDTTAENDLVWGVGLGCQGVVRVLLERVPAARPDWIATLRDNLHARRTTALTVNQSGTALAGATAAGQDVFHEIIPAPPALILCGAGDDAIPLAQLARETGWHVTVVDSRAAYATPARFPHADRIITAPLSEITRQLPLDARTFAVVMTHRYVDDREFLRALLPRDFAYLGQLGPRARTDRLLQELKTDGLALTDAHLAKLHAPVGLDLGGSTPETVALAILAELQARLTGRTPAHLRDRPGPIHG